MKTLILVRGIPGSGKSTLAAKLLYCAGGSAVHLEADQYFVGSNGYKFDHTKLGEAHTWCKEECRKAMEKGDTVIVSNTFVHKWEMAPYLFMAEKYGYAVQIIICQGNWQNKHGCPQDTIELMKKEFEY